MNEIKKPFHETVAEKLIEQLKAGTAPWQQPWQAGAPGTFLPINPTTGKRYSGINAIHLMSQGHSDQRWMTYKQAVAVGAQVRKGEIGVPIQYWKFSEEQTKTGTDGKPVLDAHGESTMLSIQLERPRVFFATVFNAEQIDGLPPIQARKVQAWSAMDRAEQILKASGAVIRHGEQNRAFYRPATDSLHLPDQGQFPSADQYYATALHELGHWTGHESRLNRDLVHPFGSEGYAREELRAEIASMILGNELGIGHDPAQHTAYVGSWIKVLQDNPLEIFRAAADAERIQSYVLGMEQRQLQEQSAQPSQPEELANIAVLTAALNVGLETVLQDPDLSFNHFRNFQGESLEATLRECGLNTVGDVTGTEPVQFNAHAHNALSPVFGIYWADDSISNAYLERKGLALAFAAAAERLVLEHTQTQDNPGKPGAELRSEEQAERPALIADNSETTEHEKAGKLARKDAAVSAIQNDSDLQINIDENGRGQQAVASAAARQTVQTKQEPEKSFINVPFKQKDEARALGAKWDRQEQAWYIPGGVDPAPFAKWRQAAGASQITQTIQGQAGRQKPAQVRQYLAVPYGERVAAKAAGAEWDKTAKSWYAGLKADMAKMERWKPDNVSGKQGPAMMPQKEFAEALRCLGCMVNGDHPIMDGQKHRISVAGGKVSEKTKSGFYVGHLDGHPAGYIKNNKTGIEMKWKSKGYVLAPEQKAQMRAEAAAKLQAREVEQARLQEQAAQRVSRQMFELVPAVQPTPYMRGKGILPQTGVFTDRDGLKTYIPATDVNGKQWTMQIILEDGTKRFAKNSHKESCFHPIGGMEALARAPALVISEGFATASSLSQSLGFATVAAFDAGNLPYVAKALHAKFPDKPVVIAGDDDQHLEATHGANPGKSKAQDAAKATGGKVLLPIFAPGEQAANPKGFTDFNDLATKSALGKEGIDRQLRSVVDSVIEKHQASIEQRERVRQEQRLGRTTKIGKASRT